MLKRIAVTGPESTGKTTLAEALAKHFNEPFVPEYAREYLAGKGKKYTLDDVLKIAQGQLHYEELSARKASRFLFCDTDLLVTKIWSEVVFNRCPEWIEQQFREHRYDLYLLCYPDIPWEPDPLRENPHDREQLFKKYEDVLRARKLPFKIITGKNEERITKAIRFVEQLNR